LSDAAGAAVGVLFDAVGPTERAAGDDGMAFGLANGRAKPVGVSLREVLVAGQHFTIYRRKIAMPLYEISATEAVRNRKSNPFATWGDRSSENRVEPIAKPAFDVPFKLVPGESIFTVGSCFARNVEAELQRRSFHIPMRDIFSTSDFAGIDVGVINNFGTPSIYNEFAWAFDERPFDADAHILEIQPEKFIDLHLISSVRPAARDVVAARRRAVTAAYRTSAKCRLIIMTLGLVEVWFDTKTATYLNGAPRPTLISNDPERFRLHVLSFDECNSFLEAALALIKKHGRADVRVLLTVSPVPLTLTQRPQDVMVANAYSKAVLRAVAETIVARHNFVTYFPSYESVTLSDRKIAWQDDLTHVTPAIVAVNIGRMVDAFIGVEHDLEAIKAEVELGGTAVAVERAMVMRKGSPDAAAAFFETFADFSRTSPEFAIQHAGFHTDRRNPDLALTVLDNIPSPDSDDIKIVLLRADTLAKLGRHEDTIELLDRRAIRGATAGIWMKLLQATLDAGNVDKVLSVLSRWSQAAPNRAARPTMLVGRWCFERGDLERATTFLERALALNIEDATTRIYLAECQIAAGNADAARATLSQAKPETPGDIKRAERLRSLLF
jgi:thioredoxin-like negative regulator of GroEL